MDDTYSIGLPAAKILLEVKISVPGEVTTIVWSVSNGNRVEIAASDVDDSSGAIPSVTIGDASLAGKDIEIRSIIDLSLIHPTLWPLAFTNLTAEYLLSGGASIRQFECDEDDKARNDSGSLIRIVKIIHIIN